MEQDFKQIFISNSKVQFEYYKHLGEKAMEQLSEKQLFISPKMESNSIAIIVKHLWGNMLSRWTNFLHEDGEKSWRQRDEEFELGNLKTKDELLTLWGEGWACLFESLDQLNKDNFDTVIYIRNKGHNVIEAVQRQMMHYAYHVGQIVFLAKILANDQWTSLSIPKNKSQSFNDKSFSKGKRIEHFVKEQLDDKNLS